MSTESIWEEIYKLFAKQYDLNSETLNVETLKFLFPKWLKNMTQNKEVS